MLMLENYTEIAKKYANDVIFGKIAACELTIKACKRFVDDLKKSKNKKASPWLYDEDEAHIACAFIEMLPHVKGDKAKQRETITLQPWQAFVVCNLFGWYVKKTGYRRFTEAYIEVPRKNGKSTLLAAIGLYMLLLDGEEGAEVYSGATTEKQAWEVFGTARAMIRRSPKLINKLGVVVMAKNLSVEMTNSKFEPLIGEPGDGSNPHCAIVDEYHEHKTNTLVDTMETGMGARKQPMLIQITTAGNDTSRPCYEKRQDLIKVLDGTMNAPDKFVLIYGIDKEDDWTDLRVWKKANPNYGVSVEPSFLERQLNDAKQSTRKQNTVLCKHLNVWTNAKEAWLNALEWQACGKHGEKLTDYVGQPCYIGLDLASKLDLTAKVYVFPNGDGSIAVFAKHYLPDATVKLPQNEHYRSWEKGNKLDVTEGDIIDYEVIKEDILYDCKLFDVQHVAYDPFQATQLVTQLMEENVPVLQYGNTVRSMSEPMKQLQAMVASKQLIHDSDPVLAWEASNLVGKLDAKDNVFPRKELAKNKIDGMVALIMAIGAWMNEKRKASSYEREGVWA
jgi:phage terminase large subunit-like protein